MTTGAGKEPGGPCRPTAESFPTETGVCSRCLPLGASPREFTESLIHQIGTLLTQLMKMRQVVCPVSQSSDLKPLKEWTFLLPCTHLGAVTVPAVI